MNQPAPELAQLPVVDSPDIHRGGGGPEARTPPGQVLTRKWPVLHYGRVPPIAPEDWSLRIYGLVEHPVTLDLEQFSELPRANLRCDIHCVTHWSRLDNLFTGVLTRALRDLVRPLPEARFVIEHAASDPGGDWTTNLPIDDFFAEDCLLATDHDGQPLTPEHGAPVRAVVPRLYFWKGAKWITGIELVAEDRPGFWERNGYHMYGDPWREQRFAW